MRNPRILVLERGDAFPTQVQDVAAGLRQRPEVVVCERVGGVADVLADEGPFDVLIAGPSLATKAGLARIQQAHREDPAMSVVLAFSDRPAANLREIVRTGAADLLHLPVDDDALRHSVEQAVELSRAHRGRSASGTDASGEEADVPGTVLTVASPVGGAGKTFLAVNLAYFLHRHTGKRTCVVDLDLQFGELQTALRLKSPFTIFDALQRREAEEADLREHIEQYVLSHETGLHVLASPRDPSDADLVQAPDVTGVLEALRCRFDYVVVDTPPTLNEVVLAALDLSDQLYVVATLDLPSVRRLAVFLTTLEKLKISSESIRLVLNKVQRDPGLDLQSVADLFPQGFTVVLPYAPEVTRSLNLGVPVLAHSPNAEVSRSLVAAARALFPAPGQPSVDGAASGARPPGPLSRLLRRSPTLGQARP